LRQQGGDQLSQLEQLQNSPDPSITVAALAARPGGPYTPNTKLALGAGLVAGLFLGIFAAFAFSALDPRLRRADQLRKLFDAPVLTRIPRVNHHNGRPMLPEEIPQPAAEGYRTLRTVLQARSNGTPRSILVTGSAPSEGKTTSAINVAASLAQAGRHDDAARPHHRLANHRRDRIRSFGHYRLLDRVGEHRLLRLRQRPALDGVVPLDQIDALALPNELVKLRRLGLGVRAVLIALLRLARLFAQALVVGAHGVHQAFEHVPRHADQVQAAPRLVRQVFQGPILGVRRLRMAELADMLASLDRDPDWWRRLYEALAAADPGELGALPVPLADGRTVTGPRGVLLGDLAAAKGEDVAAIAEYRKAIELKPSLSNLHYSLGHLLWKNSKVEDARVQFEAELALNPRHAGANNDMGQTYLLEHDPKKALPYLNLAAAEGLSGPDIHRDLGTAYSDLGEYRKAEAEFNMALSSDNDGSIHFKLARVYKALGEKDKAAHEFAVAAALNRESHSKLEKQTERLIEIEK